jgi:hypothetical protein
MISHILGPECQHYYILLEFHLQAVSVVLVVVTDGTNSEETLAKSLLLEENETRTDEAIQSGEQEQQQQCIKFDKTMKRIRIVCCAIF